MRSSNRRSSSAVQLLPRCCTAIRLRRSLLRLAPTLQAGGRRLVRKVAPSRRRGLGRGATKCRRPNGETPTRTSYAVEPGGLGAWQKSERSRPTSWVDPDDARWGSQFRPAPMAFSTNGYRRRRVCVGSGLRGVLRNVMNHGQLQYSYPLSFRELRHQHIASI